QQQKIVNNITVNKTQNVTVNKILNVNNVQNVSVVTPLANLQETPVTHIVPRKERKAAPVHRLATVPREERQRVQAQVQQVQKAQGQRQQVEARLLSQGGAPVRPTDPPKTVPLQFAVKPKESQPPAEKQPLVRETQPPSEKQPPPR